MSESSNIVEPMSRKDRERERHRQEIVRAAERIFAQKGYQAATIEEIAREAEFAVGTLYNLFKGKEELYSRVIESFVRQFMTDFELKVVSEDDPEKAIAALIALRLAHYDEHREFIRIALELSPCGRTDPARVLPEEVRGLHERYVDAVTAIYRRGIERGTFDVSDPLYYTLSMEGIINAFISYWSRNEPADPLAVRIGKVQREFLERIKLRLDRSPISGAVA